MGDSSSVELNHEGVGGSPDLKAAAGYSKKHECLHTENFNFFVLKLCSVRAVTETLCKMFLR